MWEEDLGNSRLFSFTDYSVFMYIQHHMDMAIIEAHSETEFSNFDLTMRMSRYPYPRFEEDAFPFLLNLLGPFIVMLTYLFTAPIIVKDVVLEKERKLKVKQHTFTFQT